MDEYKVKKENRRRNIEAQRRAMPVNGKSVFTIQHAIEKRATEPVRKGKR